uniref:Uncharacterized protein n=1 Tax=Anopheles farauti TaxID=69004 RepID=A0A182PZF1_9DIPT
MTYDTWNRYLVERFPKLSFRSSIFVRTRLTDGFGSTVARFLETSLTGRASWIVLFVALVTNAFHRAYVAALLPFVRHAWIGSIRWFNQRGTVSGPERILVGRASIAECNCRQRGTVERI